MHLLVCKIENFDRAVKSSDAAKSKRGD